MTLQCFGFLNGGCSLLRRTQKKSSDVEQCIERDRLEGVYLVVNVKTMKDRRGSASEKSQQRKRWFGGGKSCSGGSREPQPLR